MHPHLHRLFATYTLTLGDLIFVMGEAQVNAACVNIKLLAQVLGCHCRAFDVPARKADAPRAWPVHLARFITVSPEGEVFGSFFILGYLHLLAAMPTLAQIFKRVARQLAVLRKTAHVIIDVA